MKKIYLTIMMLSVLFPSAVFAQSSEEDKALWELGIFSGAARIPHYPGSDEYSWYVLPLPYFIYRGEIIQSDRDGLRGIFFNSEKFESSISFSGNPPVDEDNEAREGMPDLDALFEVGPGLKYFFLGRGYLKETDTLYAEIALRAAVSIGFDSGIDMAYQGLHADLSLVYANWSLLKEHKISFGGKTGADFCDSELNRYFYDVSSPYVRSGRGYYESGSGYTGFFLSGWLQKELTPALSVGVYSRWDNMNGAVFEDSPLLKEKNSFTFGCALTWKIWESESRAPLSENY